MVGSPVDQNNVVTVAEVPTQIGGRHDTAAAAP
jgi:hypothetical protein